MIYIDKFEMGKAMIIESFCPEDTFKIGYNIGCKAKVGQVYCLNGDLGVGKTVFTQGFAKGLGVDEPVNSPTFTILQEYEGKTMPFYHFDVYRIVDVWEMEEIGYEDYFYGEGVCLIEWAKQVEEILPKKRITINIKKDLTKGYDYREIEIISET